MTDPVPAGARDEDFAYISSLLDKWINYAYVGAYVPPLRGNVKPNMPTVIEKQKEEIARLTRLDVKLRDFMFTIMGSAAESASTEDLIGYLYNHENAGKVAKEAAEAEREASVRQAVAERPEG